MSNSILTDKSGHTTTDRQVSTATPHVARPLSPLSANLLATFVRPKQRSTRDPSNEFDDSASSLKLSRKELLVQLLTLAQAVCLLLGLLFFGLWIRSHLNHILRDQMVNDNRLIAQQMATIIESKGLREIEYGSEDWDRLQSVIEKVELPNSGYMCVADAAGGELICHPLIRKHPELRRSRVGQGTLEIDGHPVRISDATASNSVGVVTGVVRGQPGTEVVSVARLPHLDAQLLVHQSETAKQEAIKRVLIPVGVIGLVVGVGLILVTNRVVSAILRRYENKIAAINEGLEEAVRQRTRSLTKTRNAVIFGLAKLAESRDNDTGEHLERIRHYVEVLVAELSKTRPDVADRDFIEHVGLASSLHDIGKVGVPDSVLLKPGKLTVEEREIIEVHPLVGEECLFAVDAKLGADGFLTLAREIAASHHEKWDGTGYPRQIRGEDIPIAARIVALADVYDALRSKRPYKEAMSHEQAREIIVKGSGQHFDPAVVEAFLRAEKAFLAVANTDC